ncbi:hypothetical protein SAMN02745229_03377 [Butyrivibrio fibrisolvens DSM 3071]|uniref:Uncharacterized protein n=1 Tax=Butyrivibrio fibrisolvens DSM 3071 TaxID=1121131 RepID=A0A1M6CQD1_BUTFI|nr:hypothetical protein [Butyrivibrio fibrisolvens]SHI62938.1 hypothetical protein SAMN02745229_03377 [Butyrivibrio fibrisolvens DSM 3071]
MDYTKSEHVTIRDVKNDIERAYNVLNDYSFDIGIKDKESLKFRLLTEEVLRLVKQILNNRHVELWFEGNNRVSRIIIECEGTLEGIQKDELGSIATSGTVTEDKGFFKKLTDMFMIKFPEEESWSLKEYQRQLKAKKAEDKYDVEAWDDLERSLVANLADDIEITTGKDVIRMVVTKDFTKTLSFISAHTLEATSSQIIIGTGKDLSRELDRADDIIDELSLEGKNAIHAKLVFEETLGMLAQMIENYKAVVWLEKYKNSFCLKLVAKTEMDYDKKTDLLSLSSDHKNSSIRGFMDKIGDVIQNGLLNYENVANLSREYGGIIDCGSLGMYSGMEGISEYGMMWSLNDYRDSLEYAKSSDDASKDAWDELEKSIVANIASDVIVGVKGDKVEMTIICKM